MALKFMGIIENSLKEHIESVQLIGNLKADIEKFAQTIITALNNGNKILLMGNGGSAADSQHIAAEFVGRYKKERRGLAAIALTTDTSILTSIANDFSFDNIFARQIQALAVPGDVVIGISTSGNSNNIIAAIKQAGEIGCHTIGMLGNKGGLLKNITDLPIIVPSENTPRIQECHILIAHIVSEMVEEALYHD